MTPKQFFVVFDIPASWYFKSKKKAVWANVIREFEQYPLQVVLEKKKTIQKEGAGPWYFVEAVRRQLQLERHEGFKKMGVAPCIKEIMRKMQF
jgi:hypothetical protein